MSKLIVRRTLAAMASGAILAGVGLAHSAQAEAQPDAHWPAPYCYGGSGGGGFGAFGGTRWCDGMPYPDGSRLRSSSGYAMGGWADHPVHCVASGGPFPAPAPGACGGRRV